MALAGGQKRDAEGLTPRERVNLSLATIRACVKTGDDRNPKAIKITNEVLKRAGR